MPFAFTNYFISSTKELFEIVIDMCCINATDINLAHFIDINSNITKNFIHIIYNCHFFQ